MDKTALITGGSSGIGLELSKLFAKAGFNLLIISQEKDQLAEAKKLLEGEYFMKVETLSLDLSKEESIEEIDSFIQKNNIIIDVLVNDAGFGSYGPFSKSDWKIQDQMVRVNILALTHLTRIVLPQMLERKQGKILNLASTASFKPGPLMSVYYASKAYVLSFSVALSEELKGTGVTMTALAPGPTKSGFQKRAGVNSLTLFSENAMDPKVVAKAGFNGLMKSKAVVIPGFMNKLYAFMTRFASLSFAARVIKRLHEQR